MPPTANGHQAGKPRIFLIGFNKCGTTSFHEFFLKNDISSVHWRGNTLAMTIHDNTQAGRKNLLGELGGWTAYTDMICIPGSPWGASNSNERPVIEGCRFFKELHQSYPDALFILNTRDPFAWLNSRLKHDNGKFAAAYLASLAGARIHSTSQLLKYWLKTWHKHHWEVLNYFDSEGSDNFLLYDINHGDPAEIVMFLRRYFLITSEDFPHSHMSRL